ncbi:MAG: signal peptidase I [Oscillospiraceae bacterium]|jgi:signal peptidase I|nr:signal peptidase I [Oscillospiraceae bacterium]
MIPPNHPQNPWVLPPMPQEYDSRPPRGKLPQGRRRVSLGELFRGWRAVFLFFVFPLLLYQNLAGSDSFFGWRAVLIRADSMEPGVPKGALVLAKEFPYEELREGDVILYRLPDGQLNTHRIVAREYGLLKTKGDHNLLADALAVTEEMYVAKVRFSIPGHL